MNNHAYMQLIQPTCLHSVLLMLQYKILLHRAIFSQLINCSDICTVSAVTVTQPNV